MMLMSRAGCWVQVLSVLTPSVGAAHAPCESMVSLLWLRRCGSGTSCDESRLRSTLTMWQTGNTIIDTGNRLPGVMARDPDNNSDHELRLLTTTSSNSLTVPTKKVSRSTSPFSFVKTRKNSKKCEKQSRIPDEFLSPTSPLSISPSSSCFSESQQRKHQFEVLFPTVVVNFENSLIFDE